MTDLSGPIQVAVCEDNDALRDILVSVLPKFGLRVFGVGSSEALDCLLAEREVDLVVLDVGLPGEDGFSAAARLRIERPHLGIVMLTARAVLEDRIRGLNQGADLYFVKPVDMAELAAALTSLHRRVLQLKQRPRRSWRFRPLARTLETPRGHVVELTDNENRILERLLQEPGAVVDRELLIESLDWALDAKTYQRLATTVSRLRAKVAQRAPEEPLPLRTQHGSGYAFRAERDLEP